MKKTLTAMILAMAASASLAATKSAEVWYIENVNVQQQTQEPDLAFPESQPVPVRGNQQPATC